MSTQDEYCELNRFGKYGILYRNEEGLTKPQIIEKFSVFGEDDLSVNCMSESNLVFVNFKSRENAIKAREAFPELNAIFTHKHSSSQMPQACNENKYDGNFEKKGGYNSKDDSDNKSCSSMTSTSNQKSYQNSITSIAKLTVNDATPGSGQNKTKQTNSGNENKKPETKESAQAAGSSTQNSHCFNGSLEESTVNDCNPGSSQNKTKQRNNFGNQNKKSETKESTPSARNANGSLDGNVEDLDEIPLLVSSYEVEIMENLRTVEAIAVVLCNMPPWLHTGDVYRLLFESTGLWPLEIEIFHKEKRTVQHSAFVHFRNLQEAEKCVKTMNFMWVEYRQLICVLADEVLPHLKN